MAERRAGEYGGCEWPAQVRTSSERSRARGVYGCSSVVVGATSRLPVALAGAEVASPWLGIPAGNRRSADDAVTGGASLRCAGGVLTRGVARTQRLRNA